MHPSTRLNQGLTRMTLDVNRRMRAREKQAEYYHLAEREQQYQYPLTGTLGIYPVETTIVIKFDIVFLYEYGYRRDSQLGEPLARFGFSQLSGPPGTVPYAHVTKWLQDESFNYKGAVVMAGAHNPLVPVAGSAVVNSLDFKATLHASFQGYGAPIDPDLDPISA